MRGEVIRRENWIQILKRNQVKGTKEFDQNSCFMRWKERIQDQTIKKCSHSFFLLLNLFDYSFWLPMKK